MDTKTEYQPRCAFWRSSGFSGGRCGKPAVTAVETRWEWTTRKGERVRTAIDHEPRCRFHASIDAGRKYSPRPPVPFTPAMLATWEREAAEMAEARKADAAVKAAKAKEAEKQYRKQALEDSAIVYTVRRDDEKDTDWQTREVTLTPRWFVEDENNTSSWNRMEVKLRRRVGYPTEVEVRNGSRMTYSAAKALAEALEAATAEIRRNN